MIVYRLRCEEDHHFDSWFKDSEAFNAQQKESQILCPYCQNSHVTKAIMAPRLGSSLSKQEKEPGKENDTSWMSSEESRSLVKQGPSQYLQPLITAFHEKIKQTCEDVGKDFSEQARRIHYGEAPLKNICGQVTQEEVKDLHEEGIDFYCLPPLKSRQN